MNASSFCEVFGPYSLPAGIMLWSKRLLPLLNFLPTDLGLLVVTFTEDQHHWRALGKTRPLHLLVWESESVDLWWDPGVHILRKALLSQFLGKCSGESAWTLQLVNAFRSINNILQQPFSVLWYPGSPGSRTVPCPTVPHSHPTSHTVRSAAEGFSTHFRNCTC